MTNDIQPPQIGLMTRLVWFILFLIGWTSLVLAIIGTVHNERAGLHGTQSGALMVEIQQFFIGMPATLLAMIFAFVSRLRRIPGSVILLLFHILTVGCASLALVVISWMLIQGVGSLAGILVIPWFIGILATIGSVIRFFHERPGRLHMAAMLLLAHVLVFAINFVVGAIACC